jgi:protein TonB
MAATSQNGIRHSSSRPPPRLGVIVPSRDPMLAIIDLDKKKAGVSTGLAFSTIAQAAFVIIVGLVTNWGLLTWTHHMQAEVRSRLRADYEIDLKEEEPPPEPPREVEPEPTPQPVVARVTNNAPPPPAAPAAAAAVLTAKDEDVVDMSNTIVNGNGPGNGGVTMNNGQSNGPGGSPTGSPTGTGTSSAPPPPPPPPPPAPTVDRSRNAKELSGNWSWCPFPAEADMAQIDEARVTMEVTLRANGTPATARAIADPGNGFGRAAQACAMRAKYANALDRDGNPIPTTIKFNVTFSR